MSARSEEGTPFQPATLLLPVIVSIALVLLIFVTRGPNPAVEIFIKGVAAIGLGKFAVLILPGSGWLDTAWGAALLVVYLDVMVALPCVFNVHHLRRLPRIGKKFAEFTHFGELVLARNPWMAKATFLGVIAFVMFPLSGTGAIGGAIFGRTLGLTRLRTMIGILVGSVLGSFGMALIADRLVSWLGPDFYQSPWFKIAGVVAILLVVAWISKRYKAMAATALEQGGEGEETVTHLELDDAAAAAPARGLREDEA